MAENTELFTTAEAPQQQTKQSRQVREDTPLSKLTELIKKKVERAAIYLEVPERTGVTIKVSPNITQQQMRNWRKQAGEDTRNGMDATKFACYVVASTTVAICLNGEEVLDDNGFELNFASDAVWKMAEASRAIEAVRSFFGVDPHVESAALAILDAAGYSDTIEAVDPTKESLTN